MVVVVVRERERDIIQYPLNFLEARMGTGKFAAGEREGEVVLCIVARQGCLLKRHREREMR